MFKRSRLNSLTFVAFSQNYYELPKRIIRVNGNVYHIFEISETNIFRDVQNIYQDKASMDLTLNEFKYLNSTCWDEKFQPLTLDKTKDKFTGR